MPTDKHTVDFDVLFVGGGPANQAGALHLCRLVADHNRQVEQGTRKGPRLEPEICLIEKGRDPGAHALSGALLDDRALRELLGDEAEDFLTDWLPVADAHLYYLGKRRHTRIPNILIPRGLRHHGCFIGSMQKLTVRLGDLVEEAGVHLFPATTGAELLYENDAVAGVRTGDKGLDNLGRKQANYEPGERIRARITVFGEGPHGTLSEDLIHRFHLRPPEVPQSYGLGVKELIRVESGARPGLALHTVGWPLASHLFGGGFCYGLSETLYAVGLVCALDWDDPQLDVQAQLQHMKRHPLLRELLDGGEVIAYGAKTIPEGGWYAIPRLTVAGALLVGDSAGLVNVPYLKGIHYAMKSGMLAAETILEALIEGDYSGSFLSRYEQRLRSSYVGRDLYRSRNFRRAFTHGRIPGLILSGLGLATGLGPRRPGKIARDSDHLRPLEKAAHRRRSLDELVWDGRLVVDKLTDVHLSGTRHRETQPSHIRLLAADRCAPECISHYGDAPCRHFCPARVYEVVAVNGAPRIRINFSNCVHCKTCVIKDPLDVDPSDHLQNIDWRPPSEGGPRYRGL